MTGSRRRRFRQLAQIGMVAGVLLGGRQAAATDDAIWKAVSPAPQPTQSPPVTQPPTLTLVENRQIAPSPAPLPSAIPDTGKRPLPISLPAAMKLAQVQPIDVQVSAERTRAAQAQLDRAKVLWLPTIYSGVDYNRHDGDIQDEPGHVFGTSKSSFMVGTGPYAFFALSDAIYSPLSARQVVQARQSDQQTALNDSMLSVAEAYFVVQQARGNLAGALDAAKRSEDLVARTEKLAKDLVNPVEVNRAKAEWSRRQQAVEDAHEQWQTASSELARLLRLDSAAVIVPVEPPHLRVELIDTSGSVDELIPVALQARPELASQQALVQATLARLKQEKMRPLIPSLALRGDGTEPGGTLSSGYFGGGQNSTLSNFTARNSLDLQVLWELQNLGFGNRALVRERRAENQAAVLEMFRVQDRVAAEVAQAHEQARRAANRIKFAEEGLKNAIESAQKNLEGLSQTRRIGEYLVLVFRPQEVVAAIQALDQAYRDYYGATADSNRAQFRLYRALGRPAQLVIRDEGEGAAPCPPASPIRDR
jgi:outer membrane protein TolC